MAAVRKHFGATLALDGVDLEVGAGEVLALVGENGAGKSTLMKVLSGAHQPDSGTMWLDGAAYCPTDPLAARRAGISMIYQELSLASHLSVMENLVLGMEPVRGPFMDWREARRLSSEAMAELGREDLPLDTPIRQLPIAERQLVEIARALVVGARVLILDEPTSSLGRGDIERLFALIRRLRTRGLAIIYISHFLEEVRLLADRVTILRDGRSVGSGVTSAFPNAEMIRLMVGRSVAELYPRTPRARGEVVLELTELAGQSKPTAASLSLHRGEVLGIAGLIGAGRTEMLRAIFGLEPVRSGRLQIKTHLGAADPARQWSRGVGFVSEDRKQEGLALSRSVADNLTLSSLPAFISPRAQNAATSRWMARLGIRSREPAQRVRELSGGNQQKVAIARLLEHRADVFLLDEPTRGIDVAAKAQIYHLINELACSGHAVLLVSSYLPELLGVCDRIAVMCKGQLNPARLVSETDEHQIMLEATATEEAA